ncbi:hypothetical protein OKW49_005296 [Paraburkholderia youngii]|uniref:hypothetical protein n=1 Tax=Paraburkholderia youngii TaxID=2782701 RepID=UPI003D237F51
MMTSFRCDDGFVVDHYLAGDNRFHRPLVVGLAVNFMAKEFNFYSYGATPGYAHWSSAISHRRKAARMHQDSCFDA